MKLFFLILFVVYGITRIMASRSGDVKDKPVAKKRAKDFSPMEEVFPQIELPATPEVASDYYVGEQQNDYRNSIKKSVADKGRSIPDKNTAETKESYTMHVERPITNKSKVSLSTRSDARRAFLSSEIFNRKY